MPTLLCVLLIVCFSYYLILSNLFIVAYLCPWSLSILDLARPRTLEISFCLFFGDFSWTFCLDCWPLLSYVWRITLLPAVAPIFSGLSILDFIKTWKNFCIFHQLCLGNLLFQFKTYLLCLWCCSNPINTICCIARFLGKQFLKLFSTHN